jgi:hypothetical protein
LDVVARSGRMENLTAMKIIGAPCPASGASSVAPVCLCEGDGSWRIVRA